MAVSIEFKSSNMLTIHDLRICVDLIEKYFELPHLTEANIQQVHGSRTLWVLAKENSNIVGLATLTPNSEDNLKNILVLPSYRNKGICSMMLKSIEKLYKTHKEKLNAPSLTVLKNKENTDLLISLYQKNFYVIFKETPEKTYMILRV
jgi:N-acetylglutamate synthase-like GNAT family acetyltransferase